MRRTRSMLAVAALLLGVLGACGNDEPTASPEESSTTSATTEPQPKVVEITGKDYAFEAPDSIEGGLVEFSFSNGGQEPHFAGLAKVAEGKTYDDTKAFLTAPADKPPTGPPPFVEFAGAATMNPGAHGRATFNLPAGTYALFCALPAPDGVPHVNKGMIKPLAVTEGIAAAMPEAAATLTAMDFSLSGPPPTKAGTTVVGIRNQGKQLHEVNLIELQAGKKVDDALAWFKAPAGPPPMGFLSGVAVAPGEDGVATFDLKAGSSYAFICAIPDSLSDFVPHIVKGMYTAAFTVS